VAHGRPAATCSPSVDRRQGSFSPGRKDVEKGSARDSERTRSPADAAGSTGHCPAGRHARHRFSRRGSRVHADATVAGTGAGHGVECIPRVMHLAIIADARRFDGLHASAWNRPPPGEAGYLGTPVAGRRGSAIAVGDRQESRGGRDTPEKTSL
jgi:hypothetical protein